MGATLFGTPASHPALCGELMLRHKRVPHRRIDLVPAAHRGLLRLLGFPGGTVPALRLGRARIQGTTQIALALDALVPERPLFPSDPGRRAVVVAADSWGNEVLQPVPRRLVWNALARERPALPSYLEGAHVGLPLALAARIAPPFAAAARRLNRATDANVRQDLEALPGLIDRVDELIGQGVIGGREPNAADFQIATSVSLLLTLEDLRPELWERPAGRLARRLVPHQPGRVGRVFAA